MVRTVIVAGVTAWVWLGAVAVAHHSVGVNFDNSKAMNLTGRIKEVDIRNPTTGSHCSASSTAFANTAARSMWTVASIDAQARPVVSFDDHALAIACATEPRECLQDLR